MEGQGLSDEKRMDLLGDGEIIVRLNARTWSARHVSMDGFKAESWHCGDSLRSVVDLAYADWKQ